MTHDDEPERPRYEPEIIPPDHDGRQNDWGRPPWRRAPFGEAHATQRVYVTRIGPFGMALALLAIAAIVAIVLIAIVGAVLIWVPIIAAVLVAGALFRIWHSLGRR